MNNDTEKLQLSLLLLRASVFLVMFMWTIDKFVNPAHASKIFASFYQIGGLESGGIFVIGAIEIVILLLFLVGIQKKYTYGAVLIFHAISTLATYKQYFSPFDGPNLLFFAAWPMLAACFTLFLLRDQDKKFTVS